jgi:hypothetical protein
LGYVYQNESLVSMYKKGDIVGVIGDCMAECKILEVLPKKKGEKTSYVATAMKIAHPDPDSTFFGKNEQFCITDKQVVLKIS